MHLINPSAVARLQVQTYVLARSHATSPGTVQFIPPTRMRPHRVLVRSEAVPPPWMGTLLWLLGWIRLPWIGRRYSDRHRRMVWRPVWWRPVRAWYARACDTAQHQALAQVHLVSLCVGSVELLLHPIHVLELTQLAIGMHWESPMATPNQTIELRFDGAGGPFHVCVMAHVESVLGQI